MALGTDLGLLLLALEEPHGLAYPRSPIKARTRR
jgi:hypothetical protein